MENKGKNHLKKNLGLFNAVTIIIGMVIGSGIFFKPAIVFENAGSSISGIGAWIVGGIIAMASGLTIAEISAAIPRTGGIFAYLKELYGEKVAFLFGWVQTVVYIPGAVAALVIVLATQITTFIPLSTFQQSLIAIFFVIFITTINVFSSRLGNRVQAVVTVAKILPIAIIIFLGLVKGTATGITFSVTESTKPTGLSGFGAALLGTLWAYDGWVNIGNMAGEFKKPAKDIPKSIIIGLSVIILVYVLFNLAVMKILPLQEIMLSKKPSSDAATILFGSFGSKFIAVGILISILGAANGYIMTGVRIPYAMARDKLLPFSEYLGCLSDKFGTPIYAFIFQGILSSLYVLTGSFDMLTDLVMFVVWIFFLMTVVGIFVFRKKFRGLKCEYRVPLYPIVPIIAIVGSLYIMISTFINNTNFAIYGVLITLSGLPVYSYVEKKNSLNSGKDRMAL